MIPTCYHKLNLWLPLGCPVDPEEYCNMNTVSLVGVKSSSTGASTIGFESNF
jgi:hypothetical protein